MVAALESGTRTQKSTVRADEPKVEKTADKTVEPKTAADPKTAAPDASTQTAGAPARSISDERRYRSDRDLKTRTESSAALQRSDLESRLPSGATSLLTEKIGDGDENCLEQAATEARAGKDNVVFLSDRRTTAEGNSNGAGHTLIEDRGSGRVWDPRDGTPPQNPKAWTYKSVDDWVSRQGTASDGGPAYSVDAKVRAEKVQDVLAAPPEQRAARIAASNDPGLQQVAGRMYADPASAAQPIFLSDQAPPEERGRFDQIDTFAKDHRDEYQPDEVRDILAGKSSLGALTDAEKTRVMDHVSNQWRGSSIPYEDPPTNHSAIQRLAFTARGDADLSRFVSQDFAARSAALTEANAKQELPSHELTAQAASFATNAVFATQVNPESRRALLESLGDKAPAFTEALQLHDTRLLDGGSVAYGSVPNIEYRAAAASWMLEAAGQGAPTTASTAFVNSTFAAMTNETFKMSPDLGKNTARALAAHWHPDDAAKRDSEAARFEGILGTDQGRDLLYGKDHALGSRAENLALMRAHPEWNADTLKQSDNGWDNATIMRERAQPRARDFLELRGDEPVALQGTNLDNTVGFAMGFPPQGIPANETPEQRDAREAAAARGEHSYYRGEPAEAATKPVIDQIRAVGGDNAQVTVLPIQFSSGDTGPVDLALFRVRDASGQDRYVDNVGRRYDSFEDWQKNNQLPPGNVTAPKDGHLTADPAGGVQLSSGNTPKTVDSFGEHVTSIADKAALVGGIIAGGAILIGSGGTAAPLVVGAASAWGAYRAGESLVDRQQHGQSLNPITDAGARSDWLALGANVLGVAGAGATAAAARLARGGSALSPAAATAAGYLNVSAAGADGLAAADAGYTLASRWDQLDGGQRAQLALSLGFWGVSAGRGAAQSGGRATDMFNPNAQRQRLLAQDPILAGTTDPHAQSGRLGAADPALVTSVRAHARELSPAEASRFNADLETALANAPAGTTNDVLRLYGTMEPAAARSAYDAIQKLPAAARTSAWNEYGRASAYVDRTITNPGERAAMNAQIARVAADPRITGLNDWVRFSTNQRPGADPAMQARNLRDDLGELTVAQTLAGQLQPGQTVRVGNDANAGTRPNGDLLPSYDLRIEGPNPRNIEVYSPAGARPTASDLSGGINHANAKTAANATGTVEGAVRINWPPPDLTTGAGTVQTARNGDVDLITGDGRRIPQGNFFRDYLNTLNDQRRAPAGAANVDRLTVYDRNGNEIYRFDRDPQTGGWSGQATP